ncbi:MAG: hypothetical protein A2Y32_11525 [Spirochaetes bacterium GWF1_60_12]|nr:MAG: hypothetical protein A2Y32_11525 [Spirochaetes bacterium GWF1_60_12]
MGCEGPKTYVQPGKCLVCGMKLVPVKEADSGPTSNRDADADTEDPEHPAGGHACVCGAPGCDGTCVANCQCSFQELNLALPMVAPAGKMSAGGYACPMHCEGDKTYPAPNDCPVCGMHLVQVVVFGGPLVPEQDAETAAFRKMRRRFVLAAALAAPVLVLSMGELVPGLGQIIVNLMAAKTNLFFQLGLSVPVVLIAAAFIFAKGYQSVKTWKLNMFTLIALGTGVAWTYSLVATFVPDIFPLALRRADGLVPVYFEATVIIITLVILGQMLELLAHAKTNSAIKELLNLAGC